MTARRDATTRRMADPWDAGVVFFFGFLTGIAAAFLIVLAMVKL